MSNEGVKIGLALGGGGLLAIGYELGVLNALSKKLGESSVHNFVAYSGISAGSVLASVLASGHDLGVTTDMFMSGKSSLPNGRQFVFENCVAVDWSSIATTVLSWPASIASELSQAIFKRDITRLLMGVSKLIPESFASLDPMVVQLNLLLTGTIEGLWAKSSIQNDRLCVVSYDIDAQESVLFDGSNMAKHSIGECIAASCSIPGVFTARNVDGRRLVDGAIGKTINASWLFNKGADYVLAIQPLPISHPHDHIVSKAAKGMLRTRLDAAKRNYSPKSIFIIEPPKLETADDLPVGLFSHERLQHNYALGFQNAKSWLKTIDGKFFANLHKK